MRRGRVSPSTSLSSTRIKNSFLFVLFSLSSCLFFVQGLPSLEKIYAAWYCAEDACDWSSAPSKTESWLINRGDGKPTINVIIFAFIDPVKLLDGEIPAGMTQEQVNLYKSKNIYVMFSIGGAAYTPNWNQALGRDPVKLAQNAAAIAKQYGVGIEIDYEQDNGQYMSQLTTFVKTYRSIIPYEHGFTPSPPSILTVDLGAGTGYLSAMSATAGGWLNTGLVNWANAMVSGDPNGDDTVYWEQHLQGSGWANIPPMNASQLVGCNYASSGATDCKSYTGSNLQIAVKWIQTNKARGLAFWAAGCPAPNDCTDGCPGIQQGSNIFLG